MKNEKWCSPKSKITTQNTNENEKIIKKQVSHIEESNTGIPFVLLINGSPHITGATNFALQTISDVLLKNEIKNEIFNIGNNVIAGCTACGACKKLKKCVFSDCVNEISEKFEKADGIVIGTPVYYSSANGSLVSLLDRLFHSTYFDKRMKVGASVCVARREGCTSAFDVINKYFTISQMPIVSSNYWNLLHGATLESVKSDFEGIKTMEILAQNMAFLIKSIRAYKAQI